MISWQWWWKGPFKLTTSWLNIKHFEWIENILSVYTLMSKNDLRQAVETRQLAKENTFNTSFSSNADRQTPLQVHIIQIHSMITQFCAFEARMQPSKRFLWWYMLLLQLILKNCKCSDWNQDLTENQQKNCRSFVEVSRTSDHNWTWTLKSWAIMGDETGYILQYKIYPAIKMNSFDLYTINHRARRCPTPNLCSLVGALLLGILLLWPGRYVFKYLKLFHLQ